MMQLMHGTALSPHELRTIAVESEADPRTVARVLRGEPVRALTDQRIRRVLARRGIAPPAARTAAIEAT